MDSLVYPTLISNLPWGNAVEKVECANHAIKCFWTQLKNFVQNNLSYEGRGKL